jgi:hypothetical protein
MGSARLGLVLTLVSRLTGGETARMNESTPSEALPESTEGGRRVQAKAARGQSAQEPDLLGRTLDLGGWRCGRSRVLS